MEFLDLTLPTIAENLALDEALLDEVEQNPKALDLLRIWESREWAVIVGRGTQVEKEVNLPACEQDGVPVFRRCSGGTSVVAGPGCLMYGLVIHYHNMPEVQVVDAAHARVMQTMRDSLQALHAQVEFLGTCDLTIEGRKFSGNALRCKRYGLLYHGTVLYDFPLQKISKYLRTPPRQPEYRQSRDHGSFVRNFPATAQQLRDVLQSAWSAQDTRHDWPMSQTQELVSSKYSCDSWNRRR